MARMDQASRWVRTGTRRDRRDILVPLISCVIVNQSGLDLDATHKPMVFVCTIIDVELDRYFLRYYVSVKGTVRKDVIGET